MSNKPTQIASFRGGQVGLQDLHVHLATQRLTLLVETQALDEPLATEQNRFVFEGVVAFESHALAAPIDREGIFEHEEAEPGLRHFSFSHSQGHAEAHIHAREFSVQVD